MGYYGASRCHTNPLRELMHGPISQNNLATWRQNTQQPTPSQLQLKSMRSVRIMVWKVITARERTSYQYLQPVLPW
jgi:hypothetical protein